MIFIVAKLYKNQSWLKHALLQIEHQRWRGATAIEPVPQNSTLLARKGANLTYRKRRSLYPN